MTISPQRPPSPADDERPRALLLDEALLDARRDEAEREDARRLAGMRAHWARTPFATYALLAMNVAMFGLEELLGGSEHSNVLVRLGGLVPALVVTGEPWRLVASGFLHAGFLHIALNGYVLFIVGSSVERVLGTARFLVAYVASLLVASLATLLLGQGALTVGASGAIFGLFGVEAIVVFLRPNLLPSQLRQRHAKNVLFNLLINVAASFQPNIATMAHFGGAVGGAIVGFFLVPRSFSTRPKTPLGWALAAGAASLLVLTALGRALLDALA